MFHLPGKLPGVFYGDIGVVPQYPHAQGHARVGHQTAHRPQAHDAQGLTHQFRAGELRFSLFHQSGNGLALFGKGLAPVDSLGDFPAGQQKPRHGQFLNGVGVGAGGIEGHHALPGVNVDGQVIISRPCPGHAQKGIRNFCGMQIGAAHQYGLRGCFFRAHGISGGGQTFLVNRGNGVHGFYLYHHRCSLSYFCINSTRARTPSTGMAL